MALPALIETPSAGANMDPREAATGTVNAVVAVWLEIMVPITYDISDTVIIAVKALPVDSWNSCER